MRIVVSGDKHLGLVSDGVPRLDEQRRVLDFVVDACDGADIHVDLGDLFDSPRPSPEAYALAVKYLVDLNDTGVETIVLAGNHDKPTRASWNALDPLVELPLERVSIVSMPAVNDVHGWEGWQLALLPFVTEWEAREAGFDSAQALLDDFVAKLPRTGTLGFAHLDVEGSKRNEFDSRQRDVGVHVPTELTERLAVRTYAGHVHRYQVLETVTVVGSAIHVDFGESRDRKGLVVLEVD